MAGESDLGDLIVTLQLDDQQYREQLRSTISSSKAQVRDLGGAMKDAFSMGQMRKELATTGEYAARSFSSMRIGARDAGSQFYAARASVSALSSSMILLTGETGFFVVEAARAGLHLARLTSAVSGLGLAIKSFVLTNPLTILVGTLVTVGAKAYEWINASAEATKTLADNLKRATEEMEKMRDVSAGKRVEGMQTIFDKRMLLAGTLSQEQFRTSELVRGGMSEADASQLSGAESQLAMEKARQQESRRKEADRIAYATAVQDRRLEANRQRQQQEREAIGARAREWLEDREARIAASGESHARRLRDLRENRDEISQLRIQRAEAADTGFGISTRESSGFRFGIGAAGGVIGEQSEQRKTNNILERIDEKLRELQKIRMELETTPTLGDGL
jgi:hypothetical protein